MRKPDAASRYQRAVEGERRGAHLRDGEVRAHGGEGGGLDLCPAFGGEVEDVVQLRGERGGVAGGDEPAGPAVLNCLARAAVGGGDDEPSHRLGFGDRAPERLGLGGGGVHDDVTEGVDLLHFAGMVAEDDLRLVGEAGGEFAEVVRIVGTPLVGADEEDAEALVAHAGEGFEEDGLALPEGEAAGKGDDRKVLLEMVVVALLLLGLFGRDGVGTEEIGVRPSGNADEPRGVGVVGLQDVPPHVVRDADRAQSLQHDAVVGDLEEVRARSVDTVEGRDPRDAAPLRRPVGGPGRRARPDVQQGETLPLREVGQKDRVPADREGVLAHERQGEMGDLQVVEHLDHGAALRGDRICDTRVPEGPRDLNRTPFDAPHLKGRQNLQNLHGR